MLVPGPRTHTITLSDPFSSYTRSCYGPDTSSPSSSGTRQLFKDFVVQGFLKMGTDYVLKTVTPLSFSPVCKLSVNDTRSVTQSVSEFRKIRSSVGRLHNKRKISTPLTSILSNPMNGS